jgi:hypothetical protein
VQRLVWIALGLLGALSCRGAEAPAEVVPLTKTGSVDADYGQFYVYDGRDGLEDPGRREPFDRESLGRGLWAATRFMAVFTARQAGPVPVEVETLRGRPAPDVDAWEHVVEGSIQLSSGTLVVGSWDDTGPRLELAVPPGAYRVRLRGRGLQRTATSTAEEVDAYAIQLWREDPTPPAVLKAWPGYGRRVAPMP